MPRTVRLMPGRFPSLAADDPDTAARRWLHGLVAVPYRQAGLVAACALAGGAASLVLAPHPASTGAALAKTPVRPAGPPGDRAASDAAPLDHGIEAEIARAQAELRESEDRIATLLAPEGDAFDGVLRLDPDPGAAHDGSPPTRAAREAPAPAWRLDEARPAGDGTTVSAPAARPVSEHTRLEAELNRLQRLREHARGRWLVLQRRFDEIDLTLELPPAAAGRRAGVVQAPRPAVAGGLPGLAAGLLLGLLLAALRELRGDRMRSPREARRALGLPVLGAIPTLSARTRNAYLGSGPGASA